MSKIASGAYINELAGSTVLPSSTRCYPYSSISSISGVTILNSYESNQLVLEDDILYSKDIVFRIRNSQRYEYSVQVKPEGGTALAQVNVPTSTNLGFDYVEMPLSESEFNTTRFIAYKQLGSTSSTITQINVTDANGLNLLQRNIAGPAGTEYDSSINLMYPIASLLDYLEDDKYIYLQISGGTISL